MRHLKKHRNKYIISIFLVFILAISGYSAYLDYKNFFKVNITAIITVSIAFLFSFLLVQRKTDERKKNDMIDTLIISVIKILSESDLDSFKDEDDIKKHRTKANSALINIKLLIEVNPKQFDIEEIKSIHSDLTTYIDLVANHSNDLTHLMKSQPDLEKLITSSHDKLVRLRFKLYEVISQSTNNN